MIDGLNLRMSYEYPQLFIAVITPAGQTSELQPIHN